MSDAKRHKNAKKVPLILQQAKHFNRDEYDMTQHKVSQMSLTELKAFIRDPKTTVLQAAIASVWAKAISKGDVFPLEKFTNRMIGPVRKELSVTGMTFAELVKQQAEAAKMSQMLDDEDDED